MGENPKIALARTLAALNQANQRLEDDDAWYNSIRANFGAMQP